MHHERAVSHPRHAVSEEIVSFAASNETPLDDFGDGVSEGRRVKELAPYRYGYSTSEGRFVSEALPLYLQEIGQVPLLSAEQEVALAKTIEVGNQARTWLLERHIALPNYHSDTEAFEEAKRDPEVLFQLGHIDHPYDPETQARIDAVQEATQARRQLTESNLRLVVSVARRFMNRGMLLGDLIQEGNFGLFKAIEKFDYRRGFKFSTMATWWIRQAIARSIADKSRTVRLPVHVNEFLHKIDRVTDDMYESLGRGPSDQELAEKLGTTVGRVRDTLNAAKRPISLETPVGDDGNAVMADFVVDESISGADEVVHKSLMDEELHNVLEATLSSRERRVIVLRFGLNGEATHSLSQVSVKLGVTRERIRQIEAKALQKLQSSTSITYLRSFLEE